MKTHTTFDRIITVVLTLICLALAVIIAIRFLPSSNKTADFAGPPMEQATESTTVNVSVETVSRGTFTKTASMGAELTSSRDTVPLYSTLSGEVTELYVAEGQSVQAGDKLATIDPSTAGSKYKSTTITSPLSGTVYELPSYVGQQVSTNDTLLSLGMAGELQIEAAIPERFLSTITEGLKASFTTAAWPDETFTATLTSISPQVNATNRTVSVILSLDQPDERLKEGMFVELTLVTEQQHDVLIIPSDAMTTYLGEPVVYVVENGAAKRVPITTSASDDNKSVVTSGLNGGEQLIIAGSVVDGTLVAIVEEQL